MSWLTVLMSKMFNGDVGTYNAFEVYVNVRVGVVVGSVIEIVPLAVGRDRPVTVVMWGSVGDLSKLVKNLRSRKTCMLALLSSRAKSE
jgi:hypothetical protein